MGSDGNVHRLRSGLYRRGAIIGTIPDNVRHALGMYEERSQLKSEWERRDALGDFVIDGVEFTRLELMWVFKKLIGEIE